MTETGRRHNEKFLELAKKYGIQEESKEKTVVRMKILADKIKEGLRMRLVDEAKMLGIASPAIYESGRLIEFVKQERKKQKTSEPPKISDQEIRDLSDWISLENETYLKGDEIPIVAGKKIRGPVDTPVLTQDEELAFRGVSRLAFAHTGANILLDSQKINPRTGRPIYNLETAVLNIKFFFPEEVYKIVFDHLRTDPRFQFDLLHPHGRKVQIEGSKASARSFIKKSKRMLDVLEFPEKRKVSAIANYIKRGFPEELKQYSFELLQKSAEKKK